MPLLTLLSRLSFADHMKMIASTMTMTNENDGAVLLCNETLDGDVMRAAKPRALQPLQSNNSKSAKKNKKKRDAKKKKNVLKNLDDTLKALDDTLKEQDLCSCGKKMATKCANKQCLKCCSGCPRHKKAQVFIQQDIAVKNDEEPPKAEAKNIEPVTENVVEPKITVDTVDGDEDMPVVNVDVGGKHNDLLGSLIRVIINIPNGFCPE